MNAHLTTTPRQLKSRYPYMFDGENMGIAIARGWMPLFEQLCKDIDDLLGDDKQGFQFIQCKEKYGSARFYWSMEGNTPAIRIDCVPGGGLVTSLCRARREDDDSGLSGASGEQGVSVGRRIEDLVDAATARTQEICILCGDAASLDRQSGHVLTLCPRHSQQRQQKSMPSIWFNEEEK